ncbi:hypothetical protein HPP92_017390 [Vanilla planifolia]|uniref:Uncharacterized protein n=1 Tax=Vanilla planifolia TaxID=51239 RepID=A0A835QCP2_VANPL|nr:hypothetical protein HPP92_017390 [Vanilla planifolia]
MANRVGWNENTSSSVRLFIRLITSGEASVLRSQGTQWEDPGTKPSILAPISRTTRTWIASSNLHQAETSTSALAVSALGPDQSQLAHVRPPGGE